MKHTSRTPGVVATPRDTLAVARVAARKHRCAALAALVQERFGIVLPEGPQRVASDTIAFIGVGTGTWLAMADGDPDTFAPALQPLLDATAAVADQGSALVITRLSGTHVRQALARLIALDLHDRAFPAGCAAVTIASHISITLWRLDDGDAALPRYEIAVPRSYAESFRHLLDAAAAEFGLAAAAASPSQ